MLIEIIHKEVHKIRPKKILIGVSGGVDSMVLLHVIGLLDVEIVVAHINYGLRGDESNKDEELVRRYCDAHNLEFHCKQVLGEKPESNIQNWARNIRYRFFSELKSFINTDITVTAHNRNDSIENVVMNIIQGKSFFAFKGIPQTNGTIFRPMLSIDRQEIMEYARQNTIPFRHDESNFKNDYFRNYVRNDVIPGLKEINPKFEENVEKLTNIVQFLEDELSTLVEHCFKKNENLLVLDLFNKYSRIAQVAILEKILTLNGQFNISRGEIRNALRLVDSQVGKKGCIGSMMMYRERVGLKFVPRSQSLQPESSEGSLVVLPSINTEKTVNGITITSVIEFSNSDFSPNELMFFTECKQVLIRKWEFGDRMRPLGGSGFRKIKKILTDAKVSTATREEALVLVETDGRVIALIFPQTHSRFGIICDGVKVNGTEEFVYRIKKASFE